MSEYAKEYAKMFPKEIQKKVEQLVHKQIGISYGSRGKIAELKKSNFTTDEFETLRSVEMQAIYNLTDKFESGDTDTI